MGNCLVLELYVVECFEVLMVELVGDCLVLEFFVGTGVMFCAMV